MTRVRLSPVPRRALAALAALAVTAGVAGCSGCGALPTRRAPHRSSSEPAATCRLPASTGRRWPCSTTRVENQSYVSIVVADGEPFRAPAEKDLLIEGANDVAREESKRENRQEVEDRHHRGHKADDEEVDLLTALTLAARTVHSKNTTPNTIVVVDSGLSTAAPLDFTQEGMLEADPADVVQSLTDQDALPDLDGIAVVWQGMGDTEAPQESLSNGQRKNLEAIWTAILGGRRVAGDDRGAPAHRARSRGICRR